MTDCAECGSAARPQWVLVGVAGGARTRTRSPESIGIRTRQRIDRITRSPNLMKGKPSARDTGLTVRRAVEAEALRVAFESAVFRLEPAGQLTRSGFVDRVAACSLFRRVDPTAGLGALRR